MVYLNFWGNKIKRVRLNLIFFTPKTDWRKKKTQILKFWERVFRFCGNGVRICGEFSKTVINGFKFWMNIMGKVFRSFGVKRWLVLGGIWKGKKVKIIQKKVCCWLGKISKRILFKRRRLCISGSRSVLFSNQRGNLGPFGTLKI